MVGATPHVSASLTKQVLPDGTEIWKGDRGEIRAVVRAPGVVVVTVIGYSSVTTIPLMTGRVEEQIAAGHRVSWFGDYERMTGFDTEGRALLAKFTRANRSHFAVVGILVRSRLVALAVTVANVMVGGFIKVYTSRSDFERAIEEKVAAVRT